MRKNWALWAVALLTIGLAGKSFGQMSFAGGGYQLTGVKATNALSEIWLMPGSNVMLGGFAGQALNASSGAVNNVFVGTHAGENGVDVFSNVGVGFDSFKFVYNSAQDNVALGIDAMHHIYDQAHRNVMVGAHAAIDVTNLWDNVGIGWYAIGNAEAAYSNVFIGVNAGRYNAARGAWTGGTNNVYIGPNIIALNGDQHSTIIGANATNNAPFQVILGDPLTTNTILRGVVNGNGGGLTNLFVTYDRVELATNANVITYTTTDTNLVSAEVTVVARCTGVGNWMFCSLNDDKAANYRWYGTYATEDTAPSRGYATTNSCGGGIGWLVGVDTSTNANDFVQSDVKFGEVGLGSAKYRKATFVSDYTGTTGASVVGGFKWFNTAGVTNWTIWAPESSTNFVAGSSLIIRKVRRQ